MALTEKDGGTQTASGSEDTLATETDGKVYVLVVDTVNMVDGDVLELRIYTKVRSGNSSQLAYYATYSNAQEELNKYSVPVPANVEFKATLKQVSGTNHTYIWSILETG